MYITNSIDDLSNYNNINIYSKSIEFIYKCLIDVFDHNKTVCDSILKSKLYLYEPMYFEIIIYGVPKSVYTF